MPGRASKHKLTGLSTSPCASPDLHSPEQGKLAAVFTKSYTVCSGHAFHPDCVYWGSPGTSKESILNVLTFWVLKPHDPHRSELLKELPVATQFTELREQQAFNCALARRLTTACRITKQQEKLRWPLEIPQPDLTRGSLTRFWKLIFKILPDPRSQNREHLLGILPSYSNRMPTVFKSYSDCLKPGELPLTRCLLCARHMHEPLITSPFTFKTYDISIIHLHFSRWGNPTPKRGSPLVTQTKYWWSGYIGIAGLHVPSPKTHQTLAGLKGADLWIQHALEFFRAPSFCTEHAG